MSFGAITSASGSVAPARAQINPAQQRLQPLSGRAARPGYGAPFSRLEILGGVRSDTTFVITRGGLQ